MSAMAVIESCTRGTDFDPHGTDGQTCHNAETASSSGCFEMPETVHRRVHELFKGEMKMHYIRVYASMLVC